MKNIRIPFNNEDKNINFTLEQDFDTLNILSLSLSNDDVYSRQRGDFGVLIGRVNLNKGFGVENAKVSVFIPIEENDKNRKEITSIYPFETVNDKFPNGRRYNLLPRTKQGNVSHIPVGTFPVPADFYHYDTYVEVYEKYYKYTTKTNSVGDYMIFGVPTGVQQIHMDFDIFDTESFDVDADDLLISKGFQGIKENGEEIPGFTRITRDSYQVTPKTQLDSMPNIFSENKTIEISPFWGDETQNDVSITRCDFNINFDFKPTAIFFGNVLYPTYGFSIQPDYKLSDAFQANNDGGSEETQKANINEQKQAENTVVAPQISKNVYPAKDLKIVVWYHDKKEDGDFTERKLYGVFDGITDFHHGNFRLILPMRHNYKKINEFGEVIDSNEENGIPTAASYIFEIFENDEFFSGRRNRYGGYNVSFTPGFKVPQSINGNRYLGGWETFPKSTFYYDIENNRKRFYTIRTRFRKHKFNADIQSAQPDEKKLLTIDEYKTIEDAIGNKLLQTGKRAGGLEALRKEAKKDASVLDDAAAGAAIGTTLAGPGLGTTIGGAAGAIFGAGGNEPTEASKAIKQIIESILKVFKKKIFNIKPENIDDEEIKKIAELINSETLDVQKSPFLIGEYGQFVDVVGKYSLSTLVEKLKLGKVVLRENENEEEKNGLFLILKSGTPDISNLADSDITIPGTDGVYYLPKNADDNDTFWNPPFTGLGDVPESEFAEFIGSFYSPRMALNVEKKEREANDQTLEELRDGDELTIDQLRNNLDFDKSEREIATNPKKDRVPGKLNYLPWKPKEQTGNQWVRIHEWILGVGVSLDGNNKGKGFIETFGKQEIENINERETFYYGDNNATSNPIKNSITYNPTVESYKEKIPDDLKPENEIHRPFNLQITEGRTEGMFVNSTNNGDDIPFIEVLLEDVTDDLPDLIQNNVYSSYKFENGKFKNNYYYFGRYKQENILEYIKNRYFNEY